MKKTGKVIVAVILSVMMACMCMSCGVIGTKEAKVKDLEFTVVEEADVPQELMNIINTKKSNPFKLTYCTKGKEYLYIVIGFGAQNTGGYSISVEDLYLAKNAIYFDTTLIGPAKDEVVASAVTYPFIVVKTEYVDQVVVFE